MTNLENQLQCTAEFVAKGLKDLFFVLTLFITSENMSFIFNKQLILGVKENSACFLYQVE